MSTTLNVGIVGGTGPAGAGLALRQAAAGIDVHLGSRDEARAQSTAESLNERWALDAPIVGVTNVAACHRDVVVLEYEGTLRLLPNDSVIVRVGGEAPYPFLERIGVKIVRKEIALDTNEGSGAGASHA